MDRLPHSWILMDAIGSYRKTTESIQVEQIKNQHYTDLTFTILKSQAENI